MKVDGGTEDETYVPTDVRASTQLFVSTTRANLRAVASRLASSAALTSDEEEIVAVEEFRLNTPADRLRLPESSPSSETAAELVLHSDSNVALEGLLDYTHDLGLDLQVALERRIETGGLVFVPVLGTHAAVESLAAYSFTRVVRRMPRLRSQLERPPSPAALHDGFKPVLYSTEPADRELTVAVFDGGMPKDSPLSRWVACHPLPHSRPLKRFIDHGNDVTSALLFGSVEPGQPAPVPYGYVDHYQVLDADDEDDPYDLYTVIGRIDSVLRQRKYEFVNVSIGPEMPIEDDEVHAWTAFWDTYLSDGTTLATFAAGNNGEGDRPTGNARVQVPADCVNALAIGASDRIGVGWNRAAYSAVGPGRAPGVIKPDLLAFGGSEEEPFYVVQSDATAEPRCGTSFAAPFALRAALGARTLFGPKLGPLDLKALLIHTAERRPNAVVADVGHGKVGARLAEMVLCGDGEARVLYQGELTPAKYLRAQIPLPAGLPNGMVRIRATLVYATQVDPADPGNYTRSGLDITFRPHDQKFAGTTQIHPKSESFFRASDLDTEQTLRRDAHKWDTVMHAECNKQARSLNNPVFDIHYNARHAGHSTTAAPPIRYAMVITVSHKRVSDLYEQVLRSYVTQLEALRPTIDIPLNV
ncbi:S8 family peptidase [Nocardia gipuzkoensis]